MISKLATRAKDSLKYRIGKIMPRGAILLYHRVAPATGDDPQLLTVTNEHFKEHLQILRNYYHPASIARLAAGSGMGWITPGSVAVTFDDGYLDNLIHAAPLLEEFKIPAEVYVASNAVNGKIEFYWDVLQRVMQCGPDWNVELPPDTAAREQYVQECEKIKFMRPGERMEYLDKILKKAGTLMPHNSSDCRPMDLNGLKKLSGFKMISIGAHTVNHTFLAALPADLQQQEIEDSKKSLESVIGRKIDGFSYPYGSLSSYNQQTVGLVKKAGFKYAVSNHSGTVPCFTSRYELPRMLVRNWTGAEFKNRLDFFFRNQK